MVGHIFLVYEHCDLDLGDMTFDDTPSGHVQLSCEIISIY